VTTLRLCPCCGAPLPLPAPGEAAVQCGFCEASADLSEARRSLAPKSRSDARRRAENRAFRTVEAFKAARARGVGPGEAIHEAARAELGLMGRTDTLERVVLGLAREFERTTRTQIVDDPVAMARLLEGYLQGVSSIRLDGECHLCLPFLAAGERGPVHFERCLTVQSLAELADREPD
jgi:uncharacterized Zn finger protein (UPF0148 family)